MLAADAAEVREEAIAAALAAMGPRSGPFSVRVSAIESLHDLATLLDALLDVEALRRADVDAFLERRAAVSGRRAALPGADAGPSGEHGVLGGEFDRLAAPLPAGAQLDDRLDGLLASASPARRAALVEGLAALGVIDEERYLAALDELPGDEDDADAIVDPATVGPLRETLVGPPGRCCGVRVLAVELCAAGVVVHAHRAVNAAGETGIAAPLADECAADAPSWPWAPTLRLHDDLGTAYRGTCTVAGNAEERDELAECGMVSIGEWPFVPAMPPAAGALWLASDDGTVRIELR